jgi:hypothetical protein
MLEVKYAEFITAFQPTLIDLLIITFILPAAVESSIQFFFCFVISEATKMNKENFERYRSPKHLYVLLD